MKSVNISVPDPMRDWVLARVEAGHYAGVSDYVRELIRKDQATLTERERWLGDLDRSIELSLAQADAGQLTDATQVFDRLAARYAEMLAAK